MMRSGDTPNFCFTLAPLARDQLRQEARGGVRGDGEAEPDEEGLLRAGSRRGRDRSVDANHLAGAVEQRAAGVPGVERGVGLEHATDGAVRER